MGVPRSDYALIWLETSTHIHLLYWTKRTQYDPKWFTSIWKCSTSMLLLLNMITWGFQNHTKHINNFSNLSQRRYHLTQRKAELWSGENFVFLLWWSLWLVIDHIRSKQLHIIENDGKFQPGFSRSLNNQINII